MVSNKIRGKFSEIFALWRLAGHWACGGEQILSKNHCIVLYKIIVPLYHLQSHWGWKKLLRSSCPTVTLELCNPTMFTIKPCVQVPYPHSFRTLSGMVSPPLLWAAALMSDHPLPIKKYYKKYIWNYSIVFQKSTRTVLSMKNLNSLV